MKLYRANDQISKMEHDFFASSRLVKKSRLRACIHQLGAEQKFRVGIESEQTESVKMVCVKVKIN